jgi:transcription elongation GreA/GreB family factor
VDGRGNPTRLLPATESRLARLPAPAAVPFIEAVAVESEDTSRSIQVGDRVTIQYLDDPKQRRVTYLVSEDATDETRGVLSISSALGQALLSASVEDEIEFEADGYARAAIVLAIHAPLLLAAE